MMDKKEPGRPVGEKLLDEVRVSSFKVQMV